MVNSSVMALLYATYWSGKSPAAGIHVATYSTQCHGVIQNSAQCIWSVDVGGFGGFFANYLVFQIRSIQIRNEPFAFI